MQKSNHDLLRLYPALFQPAVWPWGPQKVQFEAHHMPPPEDQIAHINVVPRLGDRWGVIGIMDGENVTWDIPGGTLEPGESWQQAAQRELVEEAGMRLLKWRVIGAWLCRSLREQPYRPHLPHPTYYRLVLLGQVEQEHSPSNPPGAEQVFEVAELKLEDAVARLLSSGRADLADLYRFAAAQTNREVS
jgi:8-oxo-dGTP diphosphatase